MTLVLMQNTRLPKYRPLSSPPKAAYLPLYRRRQMKIEGGRRRQMTLVLMQITRLPKYRPLSSLLKAAYLLNIRNLTSIIFLFTLPDSIRLYVFGHESVSIYQKLAILLWRFTYCLCWYREKLQPFYFSASRDSENMPFRNVYISAHVCTASARV